MLKNPFLNAVMAALYIVVIVSTLQLVTGFEGADNETILIPMAMLSLLVLSVSVMALLFFYTPVRMLVENQKEAALAFFLKTIGTFAVFALVFALLVVLL